MKPKREKTPKVKNDPKHVAAARELRDRYLEHVNANPPLLTAGAKYDVSRTPDAGAIRLTGRPRHHPAPALAAPAAA